MFRDFISLLFPITCINCNRPLITAEQFICTKCKLDLPLTNDCMTPDNELYKKFAFEPKVKSAGAFIYFNQRGIAQKLLHHLKYQGKKEIAFHLGRWLAPDLNLHAIDCIIPVPLHPKKISKRGFNQSEYFARGLSDSTGIEVRTDMITRTVATTSQTGKSKLQRWTSMQNVYSEASEEVTNKRVLVVDDVITTGATIGMLCDRLIQQHVEAIHIAAIARGK